MTFNMEKARAEAVNLPGIWRERWETALDEIDRLRKAMKSEIRRGNNAEDDLAAAKSMIVMLEEDTSDLLSRTHTLTGWLIEERAKALALGRVERDAPHWSEMLEGAQTQLISEDKIGSSDHIREATKMVIPDSSQNFKMHIRCDGGTLALTKEQREAIQWAIDLISPMEVMMDPACAERIEELRHIADHIAGANEMVGLTKEQREAIASALCECEVLALNHPEMWDDDVKVLRALLASPPAWEATAERQQAIADVMKWYVDDDAPEMAVLRAMLREVGK